MIASLSRSPRWRRLALRRVLLLVVVAGGCSLGSIVALNGYVRLVAGRHSYYTVDSTPPMPVAMVFGAGIRPDGGLSPMLADRVGAAAALYRLGRVHTLLMTGDNSSADYDEVSAMKRYALSLGVPARDITLDYAGFNTYNSCYRAQPIFGVTRVVLVTQSYHLPRAIYTCRALGIDAIGLGTPDWERYNVRVMLPYTLREALATLKALWEVHVTRPPPTFLGPFEGIKQGDRRQEAA